MLLLARRLERLEQLALQDALARGVEINDAAAFKAALRAAEAIYGPVDCMINNAGVMLLGQVEKQEPGEWRRMFDVNALALLNATQLSALAGWRPSCWGTRPIAISSMDTRNGKNPWGLATDDIARAVAFAYAQPQDVNIRELVLAATRQIA